MKKHAGFHACIEQIRRVCAGYLLERVCAGFFLTQYHRWQALNESLKQFSGLYQRPKRVN
jgi:hypothetical protein